LTTPEPERTTTPRDLPGIAGFAALGSTIACTVAAGVVLGIWADSTFKTSPLCLIIGLVLGCGAATASTIALVRKYL
jgi:F0F1-type ATP synthase assembly protein I